MPAKEDKKTPARVGRVPGLILVQRWGRPSLASLSGRINEEPEWCFALSPRRKAQGCGGQDSGDGGHGYFALRQVNINSLTRYDSKGEAFFSD